MSKSRQQAPSPYHLRDNSIKAHATDPCQVPTTGRTEPMPDTSPYLDTKQAAAYLHHAPRSLLNMPVVPRQRGRDAASISFGQPS